MNLVIQLTTGLVGLCTSTLLVNQSAVRLAHALPAEGEEAPSAVAEVTREVATSPIALRYGWRPSQASGLPVELSPVVPAPENAIVDIAICLDTSGSMDGLIDSAKQKLWAIVNEFVFAEPMPTLRVALFTYGNDGHNPEDGWVKLETGLTEDLDLVSQRLFEQTTNGGTELVGRVVNSAAGRLAWSTAPGALKLIIVAGNETADQDQVVSFRDACGGAIARDIMVNAIYCGGTGDSDAESWRQVARLADGQFAAIDQGLGAIAITTPFDEQLTTLSADLNGTYLAYGEQGGVNLINQQVQDENAVGLNFEAAASRAFCKANPIYNCVSWDLVDAIRLETVKLEDVSEDQLPEAMRAMTPEQREQHVAEMQKQREAIQQKINGIAPQRDAYLQAEQARLLGSAALSLDSAIKGAIRGQAEAKGYRFPKAPELPQPTEPAGTGSLQTTGAGLLQVRSSAPLQQGVASQSLGTVQAQNRLPLPAPATPAVQQRVLQPSQQGAQQYEVPELIEAPEPVEVPEILEAPEAPIAPEDC